MRDYITVLKALSARGRPLRACKSWTWRDGGWLPPDSYQMGVDYNHWRRELDLSDGIVGMLKLLRALAAGDSNVLCINGCLLPDRDGGQLVKRRGPKVTTKGPPWFSDANHLWQMFDLDGGTIWPLGRPARTQDEMLQAARHNWRLYAPAGSEDADVVVQLSNSVGFSGTFKAHYWVAFDRMTCNESWRRWVRRYKCEGLRQLIMDPAVHKATQPLYVADPVVCGAPDPLTELGIERVFFMEGSKRFAVPPGGVVDLDTLTELDAPKRSARKPRPPINATEEEVEAALLERLREYCDEISCAPEGGRHAVANKHARTMAGWLGHRGAPTQGHVAGELIAAAERAGMPSSRARDEVRRAMNDGAAAPMEIDGLVGAWRASQRPARSSTQARRGGVGESDAAGSDTSDDVEKTAEPPEAQEQSEPEAEQPHPDAWKVRLLWTEKGGLRNCLANVNTIMANVASWAGVLGYDEFSEQIVCLKPPPWGEDEAFEWGQSQRWNDSLDTPRLQAWFSREHGFEPTSERTRAGLLLAARRGQFHPVRDYLGHIEWDGVPRLDTWLEIYCGVDCEGESDSDLRHRQYVRCVGRWWLISGVARIMQPGCKVDHVLLLEGKQGKVKKSSAFQALMPDESWFTDTHLDIGSKDAMQGLRGKWIVEFAEFDGITSRKDAAITKQYLTSQTDHYRAPYAREPRDQPRQNIFGGSINKHVYFRDETGNRRYWPVRATRVDLIALRRDRDQLWAEAARAFEAQDRWWPEDEDRALMAEQQETRMVTDPWEQAIYNYASTRDTVIVSDALVNSDLEMKPGMLEKRHEMRAAEILRELGYSPVRVTSNGRRCRGYRK